MLPKTLLSNMNDRLSFENISIDANPKSAVSGIYNAIVACDKDTISAPPHHILFVVYIFPTHHRW